MNVTKRGGVKSEWMRRPFHYIREYNEEVADDEVEISNSICQIDGYSFDTDSSEKIY